MLSKDELETYSRQLLLDEIGQEGQHKIKQAKVLVIGAGGLGCPVLQYINAAGVGTIGIVDCDTVEKSNLHRQILFGLSSIGKNKAEAAKLQLSQNNPFTIINSYSKAIKPINAIEIIREYDIIVDCTDNYTARYLINDACVLLSKPFIHGSVYKFEGQVSVFNHLGGPTYRCLFPEPNYTSETNCTQSGVVGVLPGLIGLMQANEVLKLILKTGVILSGTVLTYNGLSCKLSTLRLKRMNHNIYKRLKEQGKLNPLDYQKASCDVTNSIVQINSEAFMELMHENIQIIDVRERNEMPELPELKARNIPIGQIFDRKDEIKRSVKTIVFCGSGTRSLNAIKILQDDYAFRNLINLKDGIQTYIEHRDLILSNNK